MGTGESKLNDDLVLLEDEGEGIWVEMCLVEMKTSPPETTRYMSIDRYLQCRREDLLLDLTLPSDAPEYA